MAQVIANLLNNSAKYTDKGGQIWLIAQREDNFAVIYVRDTGIGIPADMLPRVFDLFTRIDTARGRNQDGVGIGLALVKSVVELHGGTVQAHSEGDRRGSEFVVRLPIATQHARPLSTSTEERSMDLSNRRILIVDDNIDAAESLAMLLRIEGADVRTVYDGPTALDLMPKYRPDTVLLDIGMPGMDGYRVAAKIRQEPAFEGGVLVAVTGWGQEDDIRRSKEAGFDGHLVKPPDFATLSKVLSSVGQTGKPRPE